MQIYEEQHVYVYAEQHLYVKKTHDMNSGQHLYVYAEQRLYMYAEQPFTCLYNYTCI